MSETKAPPDALETLRIALATLHDAVHCMGNARIEILVRPETKSDFYAIEREVRRSPSFLSHLGSHEQFRWEQLQVFDLEGAEFRMRKAL